MEIYKIYSDDIGKHVATITYDNKTRQFTSELLDKENSPILFGKFINDKFIFGAEPNPKSEYLEIWLKDRVVPENRDMLKETLASMGIYEYNWRELIKLNHGRSVTDWFSVEVEEV